MEVSINGFDNKFVLFLLDALTFHIHFASNSARCAEQYLRDIGLQDIVSISSNTANIGVTMTYLAGIRDAARKRKNILSRLAKSHSKSEDYELFEKAKEKLEEEYKEIEHKYEIANYIYEELLLTPWNLTGDFMDVHRNPQGTGTMQLTGLGKQSDFGNKTLLLHQIYVHD